MVTERTITHKDRVLRVFGQPLGVGVAAPDVTLRDSGQNPVSLSEYAGKVRLLSVVPALDTYFCDLQTKRLNDEATRLGDNVVVLTISAEHPYNQRRWCGDTGTDRVIVLSDHYDMSFGEAYGTHIKEYRLNQRAIFVVNAAGVITYAEYVPEIAQHPNYAAALAAVAAASAESFATEDV